MRYLTLILMLGFLTVSCSKSDDRDPDCIKDENYFSAEFDGDTLEPFWKGNLSGLGYTLFANKIEEFNIWNITVSMEEPDYNIQIWLKDIDGPGFYPIEFASADDLIPPLFQKNYIHLKTNVINEDNDILMYFSKENQMGIHITSYDWAKGILIGSFETVLYSTFDEDEKEIFGDFNVNLKTLDNHERPCWL